MQLRSVSHCGMLRAMSQFAHHALVDDEFRMPTEERINYTLANPTAQHAMSIPAVNKITLARIRALLANASADLYPEVLAWIRATAADSPSKAVELYIELLQFSVPKQKAIAVAVDDRSENPRRLSLAELHSIVSDQ
jgi:hypothetical protein